MYLNRLPSKLQEECIKIAHDVNHEFNFILSNDPILDKLDTLDYDSEFEKLVLQTFLGIPIKLHGQCFKPITPVVWNALWIMHSPLALDDFKNANLGDLDLLFYLTETGFDGDFTDLDKKADCFCLKRYPAEVIPHLPDVMLTLERIAFFPLTFYPPTVHSEGKQTAVFDVEWIANITSLAHLASGDSISDLLRKPLAYSTFYFLEWSKQNGTKDIGRQPQEETLKMKMERYSELLCEWFVKQNLITEEEKNEIYKLLTTEEEKKDG